jgi:folylpolyglutamate synthase/dihydropteroate synthase
MEYPMQEINALTEIMRAFEETSIANSRFTSTKVDEVERLGKGMEVPSNKARILSEIAVFVNGQNTERSALNSQFESVSQQLMRTVELSPEPSLVTPEDKQEFQVWLDSLGFLQAATKEAKARLSSLRDTYARSNGYQADQIAAYKAASQECGRIVHNFDRLLIYAEQQLRIGRRQLDNA